MKKILVDCERNDSVDIRCGGPQKLGFAFYVRDEEVEEMREFIRGKIEENNLSLMSIISITCSDTTPWTKEQIEEEINRGY